MITKKWEIEMQVYANSAELPMPDLQLLDMARKVTAESYAPYSKFHVGAAAMLTNGKIVTGTNQENASFPAGLCAERVLLSAASSLYPKAGIEVMAISYHNMRGESLRPISPCGVCRQSLIEFQEKTNRIMRLILSGQSGEVIIINNASHLLPLQFSGNDLRR
jgi:cytidine deaminase